MKLQTPVADQPCKTGISYKDKIMMLGSCFSDNIGSRLKNYGFDVCVNPFGTLYNPASILSSVRRMLSGEGFSANDCVEIGAGDSRTCSFFHHTSYARGSHEEFISNANERLAEAAEFFRDCNKVIITLGTSWCYRHIEKDMVVSNCLKRNPKEFVREFIFTVSPIRHFKDGAHGNQLSKASLLLGIEEALAGSADYFPAYEIVMDELRDYRFYAEDMCHPTQQTADYICERFLDWALPAEEHVTLKENIRLWRQNSHIS